MCEGAWLVSQLIDRELTRCQLASPVVWRMEELFTCRFQCVNKVKKK